MLYIQYTFIGIISMLHFLLLLLLLHHHPIVIPCRSSPSGCINEVPSSQKYILIRITEIKLTALHLSVRYFCARFQHCINWVISLWFSLQKRCMVYNNTNTFAFISYVCACVCLDWEKHVNFVRNEFGALFSAGLLTLCYLLLWWYTRFSFFLLKKGLANSSHSHLIHCLFCDFDNGSRYTTHTHTHIYIPR